MGNYNTTTWLDKATQTIRFGPDRKAVRAELQAHIEDEMADLQRIFPDIPLQEAEQRTVSRMGDPEQIGKELARVHRPWWGWALRASEALLALAILAAVIQGWGTQYFGAGYTFPEGPDRAALPKVEAPARAELGGYTFQVTQAAFLDWPEESGYEDCIQMTLRVSTPRFWELADMRALKAALTIVAPDGTCWPADEMSDNFSGEGALLQTYGLQNRRWGWMRDEYSVQFPVDDWEAGETVRLSFCFPIGTFELDTKIEDRVVMEP